MKYRLNAEDLEDLQKDNEDSGNTYVPATDEEARERGGGTISHCLMCGAEGEEGTCYSLPQFIHVRRPTTDFKEGYIAQVKDFEKYSAYIYGGYGSPFDYSLLMFTPEQAAKVKHKLCSECLTKVLKAFGKVDSYIYEFMGPKLKYHQYDFTKEG